MELKQNIKIRCFGNFELTSLKDFQSSVEPTHDQYSQISADY